MGQGHGGQRPSCLARAIARPLVTVARVGARTLNDHGGEVGRRLGPSGRPAGFYIDAWERWLAPETERVSSPVPFPSPSLALGVLADETLLSAARLVHRPLAPEHYGRVRAEAAEAIDLYRRRGWLDDPAAYQCSDLCLVHDTRMRQLTLCITNA